MFLLFLHLSFCKFFAGFNGRPGNWQIHSTGQSLNSRSTFIVYYQSINATELKLINIFQSELLVVLKQMEQTKVLFVLYHAVSDLMESVFLPLSGFKHGCETRGPLLLVSETSSRNSCCLSMFTRVSWLVYRWMTKPRCCRGNFRQPSSKHSSKGMTSSVKTLTASQTRVSGRFLTTEAIIVN